MASVKHVTDEVAAEVERAEAKFAPHNSAHESFAVLAEEVDELHDAAGLDPVVFATVRLWEHVKTNQARRNLVEMRKEALQVAAMAVRFIRDVCDGGRGRK